jgi:predicted peptidase
MSMRKIALTSIALCMQLGVLSALPASGQEPQAPRGADTAAGQRRGRGPQPVDPRAQIRTYHFADTNESIPYAVFVSSKVRKDRKNPLIIALHGLGGTHTSLLRGNALDLAEQGGYIIVGPMGYNPRGWYGISSGGRGRSGRGTDPNDPPNLRELSEKDVMNVLDIIRREFSVDERRTYLMGHSMGGAGTFYLGVKYASNWAAIAAIAPAAFSLQPSSLSAIREMPVIVIQGDADTAVPVENTRRWIDTIKELGMTHKYVEIPGGDHGSVISTGMPEIFAFFSEHTKAPR